MRVQRFSRNLKVWTARTALVLAPLSACAIRTAPSMELDRLFIDNATDDVIRVSIDLGDREVRLGHIDPMRLERLRIPPGSLSPAMTGARIRVIAVGTPAAIPTTNGDHPVGVYSDWYRPDEMTGTLWRYSGGRIIWMGSARR